MFRTLGKNYSWMMSCSLCYFSSLTFFLTRNYIRVRQKINSYKINCSQPTHLISTLVQLVYSFLLKKKKR
jgi:hypothetical protein